MISPIYPYCVMWKSNHLEFSQWGHGFNIEQNIGNIFWPRSAVDILFLLYVKRVLKKIIYLTELSNMFLANVWCHFLCEPKKMLIFELNNLVFVTNSLWKILLLVSALYQNIAFDNIPFFVFKWSSCIIRLLIEA